MNKAVRDAGRILVIDLLYLGDLLFATPLIRNLRKNHPQARIDMIVNANFFAIIEDNPYLDNVYAYDKDSGLVDSWQFARKLRANSYDLGLNIHGNWRTAMILRLIKPDYSIGFGGKGRGIWLDQELILPKGKHMVDIYLYFLQEVGIEQIDDEGQEIGINEEAKEEMQKFLQQNGVDKEDRLIGLNTGGSWPTKRWTEAGFVELADCLQKEYGAKVIFFGGPGDVERVEAIVSEMETEPIIAAGKTTLKELAALAYYCDLFISGDTGPVHVAASVGTPTIAIFGPSDETKYQPYGKRNQVAKTDLDCRPCGEHQCPLEHHNCMEMIRVKDILERVSVEIDAGE